MRAVDLTNPNIPLVGAKEPDLEEGFRTTLAAQSRAVETVWAKLQEHPYGSAEWGILAQRFARHILGIESVTGLARAVAEAQTRGNP